MIPNACVVEVIERVPDADVAIVAARVGERLGMPQERVRQLIDGRTGPITRALRPEKADAIAQTFEAAGVRVVIRAADADEIEEARGAVAVAKPADAATEPADAATEPADDREPEPEPDAEPEPERDAEPEPERDAEPEPPVEPELDPASEPEARFGSEPELEWQQEPAVDPEPEPGAEPEFEFDPALEFAGESPSELDSESTRALDAAYAADPAPAFEPEPEPDFEPVPGFDPVDDFDPDPDPDPELEADVEDDHWTANDDLVPGPDAPTERGLAREVAYIFATGESPAWRGPSEDLDAPDPDEEDWAGEDALAAGGPGGAMDVKDAMDVDEPSDDAIDADAAGQAAGGEVARPQDAFPPVGGWEAEGAGAWSTRRAAGHGDGAAGGAAGRSDVPEFAIGRASRRPRDGETGARAADEREADDRPTEEAPPIDVADGAEAPTAAFVEGIPLARPIPTAWRGLGGAEVGPARPPSARLPRRPDPLEEPRFVFDEPPVRRRAVMLAALGVAVVLFVLVQWWVASRAGAAGVDPFDAYRRGEFASARAVWDAEAAAGDPSARFMLGYLAEAGLGAPWSARTAAGWYQAAADVGHAEAMWRLARLYEVGLGVTPDTLEARRWYRSAAQAGHAEAAFAWGRIVLYDAGVALGAGASPQVATATAAEAAAAFGRAAELGWHEAAPYAAAFAAVEAP